MEVWQNIIFTEDVTFFDQNWGLMLFETPGLLIDSNSTNANDR